MFFSKIADSKQKKIIDKDTHYFTTQRNSRFLILLSIWVGAQEDVFKIVMDLTAIVDTTQ